MKIAACMVWILPLWIPPHKSWGILTNTHALSSSSERRGAWVSRSLTHKKSALGAGGDMATARVLSRQINLTRLNQTFSSADRLGGISPNGVRDPHAHPCSLIHSFSDFQFLEAPYKNLSFYDYNHFIFIRLAPIFRCRSVYPVCAC